jgi:hypothetical protein
MLYSGVKNQRFCLDHSVTPGSLGRVHEHASSGISGVHSLPKTNTARQVGRQACCWLVPHDCYKFSELNF